MYGGRTYSPTHYPHNQTCAHSLTPLTQEEARAWCCAHAFEEGSRVQASNKHSAFEYTHARKHRHTGSLVQASREQNPSLSACGCKKGVVCKPHASTAHPHALMHAYTDTRGALCEAANAPLSMRECTSWASASAWERAAWPPSIDSWATSAL
jgi:hypothetical protein